MKARGLAGTDSRVRKVGRGQGTCGRKRRIDQKETMSALAVPRWPCVRWPVRAVAGVLNGARWLCARWLCAQRWLWRDIRSAVAGAQR